MRVRGAFAIVAGTVVAVSPAGADVLHLRNGERVRGVIVRESESGITLKLGPKMQVEYGPTEVGKVERESAEANAALKAAWRETEAPSAVDEGRSDAAAGPADGQASPDPSELPPRGAAPTPEQRRREDLIDELDLDEELMTPDQLKSTLGPPQVERTGFSAAGQKVLDFGYDIGRGLLRIVRFREMHNGYGATDMFDEALPAGDSKTPPQAGAAASEPPADDVDRLDDFDDADEGEGSDA